jgi:hypothetical protein
VFLTGSMCFPHTDVKEMGDPTHAVKVRVIPVCQGFFAIYHIYLNAR